MINRRRFTFGALAGLSSRLLAGSEAARVWPSEPPSGCPFPASPTLTGIRFSGTHTRYATADTWYPSWASDGNLYSPWTDGKVGDVSSTSFGKKATTGYATILGDSPLDLKMVSVGVYPGDPAPYGGRYPCGSLVYSGIWYYGTYCLMDTDGDPGKGLNWDVLGPFVGFRRSADFGKTWIDTPHTPAHPLFPEPDKPGGPVKIGSPHFVDFGKNLEHSPDGKAYLVGHGAVASDPTPRPANLSWITGDQIYLARVKPSLQTMNDRASWEYYGGASKAGRPVWVRDFAKIRPLFEWNNRTGCVTITYNAPLKKFLMCVTDGGNTISRFNTYILEAEAITGPWRLVTFMRHFGEQAYFVNFPSKFIASDGRSAWLLYAANFTNGPKGSNYQSNPPGGRYGMCLQEVKLV
jgi:hypothetical protein